MCKNHRKTSLAIHPWPNPIAGRCPRSSFGQSNLSLTDPQSARVPLHSELCPFTLSTSLRARDSSDWWLADQPQGSAFYNSNCCKPNRSASPFGKAQLDNNRPYSVDMAQGLHSWQNVPPSTVSPSESEQPASPEKETPTPSHLGPPDAPALDAPVPAPAPAQYTEEDHQIIIKLCRDSFLQAQPSCPEPGPRKSPLKARFLDLYHRKSHIECYQFFYQCEDHFATAGATGPNQTPFAASFLFGRISFCWNQHKLRHQATEDPLFWGEFKSFLRKSLGDSRSFVDVIWNRIKRDCQYQQEEVQD